MTSRLSCTCCRAVCTDNIVLKGTIINFTDLPHSKPWALRTWSFPDRSVESQQLMKRLPFSRLQRMQDSGLSHWQTSRNDERLLCLINIAENKLKWCCRDVFDIAEPDHFNSASREPFKMENLRCPITDASCTAEPFAALSKCGHLFSQRSVDQVNFSALSCSPSTFPAKISWKHWPVNAVWCGTWLKLLRLV